MYLKRYLNKQVFVTGFAILFVLLLIFSSQQFVRYLGDVVEGKIDPGLLLGMVGLQLPPLLGFLIPLAVYLGVLVSFGQLYVDNELTVTKSLGVGDRQLLIMLLPLGLVATVVAGWFSLYVTPWASDTQQSLLKEQDQQSELALLTPGKFQVTKGGEAVLYAARGKRKEGLEQLLFVELPTQKSPYWYLVSTDNAQVTDTDSANIVPSLILKSGETYSIPVAGMDWQITQFDRYQMSLSEAVSNPRKIKLRSVSTHQLLTNLSQENWAEFHWRMSVPISVFILLMISVPMSKVQPRQGKFAKMLPGILVYMSYMVLILISKGLIEDGKLHGVIGLWPIHFVFLMFGFWQYRHSHKKISSRDASSKTKSVKGGE
ncbi:MAG: LPS export ABC transporter permease LptF [Gammaproteobacteria bacterium]|nr:LPS export ABC transporter permease LptF [Gammaproteobacteria bacterium]